MRRRNFLISLKTPRHWNVLDHHRVMSLACVGYCSPSRQRFLYCENANPAWETKYELTSLWNKINADLGLRFFHLFETWRGHAKIGVRKLSIFPLHFYIIYFKNIRVLKLITKTFSFSALGHQKWPQLGNCVGNTRIALESSAIEK